MTDPQLIPAATLILMRETARGAPELLMMERAKTMAFAAGALVFPGGRVDPDDHVAADLFGADTPDGALRIAAIRETIEEVGLAPALDPLPDAATIQKLRESLAAGESFSTLLEHHGLIPDLGALTPFARWCPTRETRRFDTHFYIAEALTTAPAVSADQTESVHVFWAKAADILRDVEAGRAHAIYPTQRNLERLARFASIAEARADAARHGVSKITPWIEEREGGKWLCIPEGIGYPVTAESLETVRRG